MKFNIQNARVVEHPLKESETEKSSYNSASYRYTITVYRNGLVVYDRKEMSRSFKCLFQPHKREANIQSVLKIYRNNKLISKPDEDYKEE